MINYDEQLAETCGTTIGTLLVGPDGVPVAPFDGDGGSCCDREGVCPAMYPPGTGTSRVPPGWVDTDPSTQTSLYFDVALGPGTYSIVDSQAYFGRSHENNVGTSCADVYAI